MCRWMSSSRDPILRELLLFKSKHARWRPPEPSGRFRAARVLLSVVAVVVLTQGAVRPAGAAPAAFRALRETRPVDPTHNQLQFRATAGSVVPRLLVAGDSWAQYMWDDGSHNDIFDKFGHGDKRAFSISRSDDPGPGYTGPEVAIGGSEARQWADTANYPWIANMVAALQANPTIDTVLLSIGGNDVLAGKSDGGWYKDMDLDVPGSEAAFFQQLEQNTMTIINAALAVRPTLRAMLSSYDYPNFNVGLLCFVSACPMRRNLSRDPVNDLITDAEINAMLVQIESLRIGWANTNARILYDHSVGLMHYYYGDGVSPPGALPHPGQTPPAYLPFPGGNPLRPSLRSCFRRPGGLDIDPIHLDYEGYQYKITNETQARFFPEFRGEVTASVFAAGGAQDGWCDGAVSGTDGVRVGRIDAVRVFGIVSFDTAAIPENATITGAALYLHRQSAQGTNPFTSGALGMPQVDIAHGSFGNPAVEPADATAAADAVNAGAVFGSAKTNGYAIRIEIDAAAFGAIHTGGTTQFRLGFATAGAGTGVDQVMFADGDMTTPVSATLPTLSHLLGTGAPLLDVTYELPVAVGDSNDGVEGLRLLPSGPNPFVQGTTLRFALPRAGAARLSIHDVAGSRVVTLVDGTLPAGWHGVVWDGRTSSGGAAATGVYWARLHWQGHVRSQRVIRLAP